MPPFLGAPHPTPPQAPSEIRSWREHGTGVKTNQGNQSHQQSHQHLKPQLELLDFRLEKKKKKKKYLMRRSKFRFLALGPWGSSLRHAVPGGGHIQENHVVGAVALAQSSVNI